MLELLGQIGLAVIGVIAFGVAAYLLVIVVVALLAAIVCLIGIPLLPFIFVADLFGDGIGKWYKSRIGRPA